MKKFIWINTLLLAFPLLYQINVNAVVSAQSSKDLRSCILTDDNKPTENLKKVFEFFNVKHDGTLQDMAQKAKDTWGWPLWGKDFNFDTYESQMPEIKALFEKLGMVNTVEGISKDKYKYAVVTSGWVPVTFSRLHFLKEFWDKGVRFEKIVILVSSRDLVEQDWESNRCIEIDKNLKCKTEYELTKAVFDKFDMPEEMKKIPVVFVNTPMQKNETGEQRNPYVREYIHEWMNTEKPDAGDCLVVVNQPYVGVLHDIVHSTLPESFETIDTVGYQINQKYETILLWLNVLTWWLDEEQHRLKK